MDILSYLMGKQSAGGGGGGVSFGAKAGVIVCEVTGGTPDPSTVFYYAFDAYTGNSTIVSGEVSSGDNAPGAQFAAGVGLNLYFSDGTLANNPGIALYDFDFDQGTLTEIQNALTVVDAGGFVTEIDFTMPDLVDGQTHTAIIGIPGSN